MAFNLATVWEVRPTNGSDNNGGGFAIGVGTPSPSAATDLTVDATNNKKVTSASHNFVSGDIGKYIQVSELNSAAVASGIVTTLNGTINSAVTAIIVTSGTNIANNDYIEIDSEWMLVTAGGGTANLTVTRGAFGSTAASHTTGHNVANFKYMWGIPQPYPLIGASTSNTTYYQIQSVSSNAAILDRPVTTAGNPGTATWSLYTGVDYTLFGNSPNPQVVIDNITITCTTPGANSNTLTFTAGYTPTAADVGNVVQILSGGTNINAGFYQITAFTGTTWTVQGATNLTTAGGAGSNITGNMGGALKTLSKPPNNTTIHQFVWVKAEGSAPHITITAGITLSQGSNVLDVGYGIRYSGYTTTRGDLGKVTIQLSTNTGLTALTPGTADTYIDNFVIDCNSLGTSQGISSTSNSTFITNCEVKNFTLNGIVVSGTTRISNCEVHAGTSAATAGIKLLQSTLLMTVTGCYIHDNACSGIDNLNTGSVIAYNIIDNNSGATSDGIFIGQTGQHASIMFNTINRSGRHACNIGTDYYNAVTKGNIFANSGFSTGTNAASAYGLANSSNANIATSILDGNAYYNNLTAPYVGVQDQGSSSNIYSQGPYVNVADVVIMVNPFVNVSGQNYALNSTTGGGAALTNVGGVFSWPGTFSTGNFTFGAVPPAPSPSISTFGGASCS